MIQLYTSINTIVGIFQCHQEISSVLQKYDYTLITPDVRNPWQQWSLSNTYAHVRMTQFRAHYSETLNTLQIGSTNVW